MGAVSALVEAEVKSAPVCCRLSNSAGVYQTRVALRTIDRVPLNVEGSMNFARGIMWHETVFGHCEPFDGAF